MNFGVSEKISRNLRKNVKMSDIPKCQYPVVNRLTRIKSNYLLVFTVKIITIEFLINFLRAFPHRYELELLPLYYD